MKKRLAQDAHSGGGDQQFTGFFQQGNGLLPADRRKNPPENRQASRRLPDNQSAGGNARAGKARCATHDFRVNFDNRVCIHANN
jgi:hypothetical protein